MLICARCGRENPEASRFCNACGAELTPAAPRAAEERKVVTVLFADVAGSTALGERLDAEALKEVMGAFFEAMREEIEAEGGTVEKFIGDAVMAAFGVPRVHEDDPARALRAALRMLRRLEDVNAALERRYGVSLALRIGINTGEVMAVTEPRPGEALATGDAVNAAARLEQAAAAGQVLVADRTARAARGFRFAPPRSLELRGKAAPLDAVELIAEQPVAEGALSGMRAPLVGRVRELELLTTTYRRVVEEGRPHLVTLYGDAGVGKSRLAGELLAGLEASDPVPQILRGRCLAYGDGVTYWPLAEMLKGYARTLDSDPVELARDRVVGTAGAVLTAAGAGDPGRLAGLLGASIGLAQPDGAAVSPQELRAETQLAWRAFFSAVAAAGPAIAVVEDIHWADAAVLELLEHVGDRATGPLLVLCLARPELRERRPTWGGGRRSFTGLAVEPLGESESARLIELLPGDAVAPRQRAAILARAEGNPFFLEEIVRTHMADGALPDTVQAALAARIDLLPPAEKRALQAAAVVGRVFWPGAVAEVAGLISVEEPLDHLQDRDLVLSRLASSMGGERELVFKHALIRDVAYESLPRRDRVRMHRDVAAWIERTFASRRAEVIELIAHHLAAAQRVGPSEEGRAAAFAAVVEAAEAVYARSAFEKATSLAREGVELAAAPLERARALEALGYASFVRFEGDAAWEALREAADIVRAEAPHDRARLARICGFAVMIPTRAGGLMRVLPPADVARPYLELGLQCAGDEDSEALVYLLASRAFWDFGFRWLAPSDVVDEEAPRAAERAREIAQRLQRPDLECLALDSLTSTLILRGLYGLTEPIEAARLEIARGIRDPFEVTDTFYTAAWTALEVGRYRDVVDLLVEFDAIGLEMRPFGAISVATIALLELGDWDGALGMHARARALLGEHAGRPPGVACGGYGAIALIHELRGDRAAADAVLAEIDPFDAAARRQRSWAVPYVALVLGLRGEHEAASAVLGEIGDDGLSRPRRLTVECTLVAERGAWDEAAAVVEAARAHAEAARLLALLLHADRLEGRMLLATGAAEAAIAPLERARDGFAGLGARWQVALTELAIGGDDSLARAEAELARLRVFTEGGRSSAPAGAARRSP